MTVAAHKSRPFQSLSAVVALFAIIAPGPARQVSKCLLSTSPPRAVAPGAHCPLMHPSSSQSKSSPHHCCMHQKAKQQRCELRCACSQQSPVSSPELISFRFVLPHVVSSLVPPATVVQGRAPALFFPEVFLAPPDPPPRLFSLIAV
jgi:hypothetical protein